MPRCLNKGLCFFLVNEQISLDQVQVTPVQGDAFSLGLSLDNYVQQDVRILHGFETIVQGNGWVVDGSGFVCFSDRARGSSALSTTRFC